MNVDLRSAGTYGFAGGWKIDLSWTSGNEEDLDGFRIYRSLSKDSDLK
jgi:hypothetical protein